MPTYDYKCAACDHSFAEIRSITDYSDKPEDPCPSCGALCGVNSRDFSKSRPLFSGTSVQNAEFNPGLGQVVKNKYHREELARKKGLVEVGNDFNSGEKMQDIYKQKKKEELESKWKDPTDFFL